MFLGISGNLLLTYFLSCQLFRIIFELCESSKPQKKLLTMALSFMSGVGGRPKSLKNQPPKGFLESISNHHEQFGRACQIKQCWFGQSRELAMKLCSGPFCKTYFQFQKKSSSSVIIGLSIYSRGHFQRVSNLSKKARKWVKIYTIIICPLAHSLAFFVQIK